MPETGEGTRTKKKGGRTTPERGRNGGFCLSTPLHAPGSSSTYTAVYGHSSTCHTAARTWVGIELVPVSCRHVHQHNICSNPRYGAEISIFLRFSAITGSERPVPGRASRRPPLAEVVIGARSFAVGSESCCEGRAWSHREAAGGQVELGSRNCFLGML